MINRTQSFNRFNIGAGDLNHRISIQSVNITPAAGSGVDATERYVTVYSIYAAIKTVTPKKPFDGTTIDEPVTHQFFVRYFSGMELNYSILHMGQRYRLIQIVNINNANQWLRLDCTIKGSSDQVNSSW